MTFTWQQLDYALRYDLPTHLALLGLLLWLGVTVGLYWYGITHYTRVPGGKWTTWEKTLSAVAPVAELDSSEHEAA